MPEIKDPSPQSQAIRVVGSARCAVNSTSHNKPPYHKQTARCPLPAFSQKASPGPRSFPHISAAPLPEHKTKKATAPSTRHNRTPGHLEKPSCAAHNQKTPPLLHHQSACDPPLNNPWRKSSAVAHIPSGMKSNSSADHSKSTPPIHPASGSARTPPGIVCG